MSQYTTNTRDKLKSVAVKRLLCGGIGLHLFYVGRVKAGLIQLIIGLLLWGLAIDGIVEGQIAMTIAGLAFLVLINVPDFIKLKMGTFRDNVGNILRE